MKEKRMEVDFCTSVVVCGTAVIPLTAPVRMVEAASVMSVDLDMMAAPEEVLMAI